MIVMPTDYYRQHLKRASWDWMEDHRQGVHKKDRVYGRAEKRSARQKARIEILKILHE